MTGEMFTETGEMFTEWNKTFDKLRYKHETWSIFRDFLDMTIDQFTIPDMPPLFTQQDKYTEEEYRIFDELFKAYIQSMNKELEHRDYFDFLGMWWESDQNMTNKFKAQFFTPVDVADLMCMVTVDQSWDDKPRVMYDCCCGSGRFGLAWNNVRPMDFYFFQDLDDYAVKMTVLNMLVHGMRGVVAHMNTLTRECFWCCQVSPFGSFAGLPYVVPYGGDIGAALSMLPREEDVVKAPPITPEQVETKQEMEANLDAWF